MKGHIAEKDIALLAGGEIDAKLPELESHLSACTVCAGLLRRYREDQRAIKSLITEDIPAEEYAAVRESVRKELEGTADRVPGYSAAALRWAAIAASVIIAAVLGLWWMRHSSPVRTAVTPAPKPPARLEPTAAAPLAQAELEARSSAKVLTHPIVPGKRIEEAQARSRGMAKRPAQFAIIHRGRPAAPDRPLVLDDVAIKMETMDPNVIIIWLASPKGE